MSDSGDQPKYKWTPEATGLLVSVWSDRQVQKQLEYASKPQIIWESVARYMRKKGYNVGAKQCRSRMKQLLVCYREAKRAGTRAGVEQYYESIDRVLKNKRLEHINGIDTVDAAVNVRSPPKDVKTCKNLQMRCKSQEPVQSLYRTEALSPTWTTGCENEYPDSPESNDTIVARPSGVFSPTRDVAINTGEQLDELIGTAGQRNFVVMEEPVHKEYRRNILMNYPCSEVPYQNTVQNVQNQIIQENMQQHQNLQQNHVWNQVPQQNLLVGNVGYQQQLHNLNQAVAVQKLCGSVPPNVGSIQNNVEHILRQQNQLQQNQLQQNPMPNNRAMPQEPRKVVFGQNLAATYKQYQDPRTADAKQNEYNSPNYSPNVSQNLNDAFCQSTKSERKADNLNDTFNLENALNPDVTVITNNATCNDDSLLLEYLLESPIPSETDSKSKSTAVNTDIPNAPLRKKKAQKLEQLVLSAINSQNEVVNKILAAQNDMVSRFLDIDRDRQNRLENRLDHLLNVVHATVLNKNSESEPEMPPPPPEPTITSLVPPPKPGVIPPKLDLVPPKPCRVPCTIPNSNVELINQNPVSTKPGVISPITSPGKKLGTIWSKLGPVSQSPFVKAQQRLGLQTISNTDTRTQSSAERRIVKEFEKNHMDTRALIFETTKFLQMEKMLEETIENARRETAMSQNLTARRRLFTQREPNAAMILTTAFLEEERRVSSVQSENIFNRYNTINNKGNLRKLSEDNLLAGQGESYDRLRQLRMQSNYLPSDPCDSSTPAKLPSNVENVKEMCEKGPKQTIQQLAQLVMNSARWKDAALQSQQRSSQPAELNQQRNRDVGRQDYNATYTAPRANAPLISIGQTQEMKDLDWISTNEQKQYDPVQKQKYPMGFTTAMLGTEDSKPKSTVPSYSKTIGFADNVLPDRKQNVRFMDEALAELQRMYIERNCEREKVDGPPFMTNNGQAITAQNRQMIERYVRDMLPRNGKDKDTDSDNDEEFLDTTASMPPVPVSRRGSLTSTGTASTETHSTKFGKLDTGNCVIS